MKKKIKKGHRVGPSQIFDRDATFIPLQPCLNSSLPFSFVLMTRNELCFRLKLICISPTVSPGIRRFSWQFTDCERVSSSRCITSRGVCKGVYRSASNLCLWATGLIWFWFRCLGCLLLSIWTIEVPRICGEDCRVSLVMLYSRELITVLVWHSRVGPTVRRSGLYTLF